MSSSNIKSLLYTVSLIVYLGFIFYLSSLEQPGQQIQITHIDKVFHFIIYLPMPWLFFLSLRASAVEGIKYNYFNLGIILSLIYAATDEWHQSFVPTRNMDFLDFLADAAGILAGAFLFRVLLKLRGER